jgi:hypothetical protein
MPRNSKLGRSGETCRARRGDLRRIFLDQRAQEYADIAQRQDVIDAADPGRWLRSIAGRTPCSDAVLRDAHMPALDDEMVVGGDACRRPARDRISGMWLLPRVVCSTMSTDAGRSRGRSPTTRLIASTPPADAPMTATSCLAGLSSLQRYS